MTPPEPRPIRCALCGRIVAYVADLRAIRRTLPLIGTGVVCSRCVEFGP